MKSAISGWDVQPRRGNTCESSTPSDKMLKGKLSFVPSALWQCRHQREEGTVANGNAPPRNTAQSGGLLSAHALRSPLTLPLKTKNVSGGQHTNSLMNYCRMKRLSAV